MLWSPFPLRIVQNPDQKQNILMKRPGTLGSGPCYAIFLRVLGRGGSATDRDLSESRARSTSSCCVSSRANRPLGSRRGHRSAGCSARTPFFMRCCQCSSIGSCRFRARLRFLSTSSAWRFSSPYHRPLASRSRCSRTGSGGTPRMPSTISLLPKSRLGIYSRGLEMESEKPRLLGAFRFKQLLTPSSRRS